MGDVDVALVQEAGRVAPDVAHQVWLGPEEHYDSHRWNARWYEGRWPRLLDRWPMVVRLSERVELEWFKQVSPISFVAEDEFAVSGIGTIAAARVVPEDERLEPLIAVSMYARWMSPHPSTRSNWRVGHSDGSAHRILSDLSAFIGDADRASHRIIAASDLNMVYGGIPIEPQSLAARDQTVFERFAALGLELVGPQFPLGRKAEPKPVGLPSHSGNVPTYYTTSQTPETAQSQLDYLFASRGFHVRVTASAEHRPRVGLQRPLRDSDRRGLSSPPAACCHSRVESPGDSSATSRLQ